MSDSEIGRTIAHASFNVLAFDAAIIDFNPDVGVPNSKGIDDWQQKMSGDTLIVASRTTPERACDFDGIVLCASVRISRAFRITFRPTGVGAVPVRERCNN